MWELCTRVNHREDGQLHVYITTRSIFKNECITFCVCVHVCVCMYVCTCVQYYVILFVPRPEKNLKVLILYFYHMGQGMKSSSSGVAGSLFTL